LVVEYGRTSFPALKHAKEMLDRVGAQPLGAVMNKVRGSAGFYAYAYGYYAPSSNGRPGSAPAPVAESEANPAASKDRRS
jgi:hypothetical protein